MVHIHINGEGREIPPDTTIAGLLAELKMASQAVAVEVNLQLVPRSRHTDYLLAPGDQLEIVAFKGGG